MSFHACVEAKDIQLAPTMSWRTHRMARRKRDVSFVLYNAIVVILRAYLSRNSRPDLQKGDKACPAVGSARPESENLCYELGFQPPAQFFIHAEMGIAVFVVQLSQ